MLFPLGRTAEAGREIEQVVAIAAPSRNPLVKARAWTAQAHSCRTRAATSAWRTAS